MGPAQFVLLHRHDGTAQQAWSADRPAPVHSAAQSPCSDSRGVCNCAGLLTEAHLCACYSTTAFLVRGHHPVGSQPPSAHMLLAQDSLLALQASNKTLQSELEATREEANRLRGSQQRYLDNYEQRLKALYIKASNTS